MRLRKKSGGFTLIEVLIALVILAVGLLGMATLMTSSMQSSQGAYRRSQASLLAYDIVERMRFNREQAVTTNDYVLTTTSGATTEPSCGTGGCTATQQAQLDMFQWRQALSAALPGAVASISRSNDFQYQIIIAWDEVGSTLKKQDDSTVTPTFTLRIDL
ncbi:type IV pilus modification protein PilV [Pseudomonas schmalbachii]|uniref:Type IV pilus modification protein PilV n=1 Tax=Pseudomonas schmalbachii TaxID=2816993 RepID=A0ABS3TSV7_9PSED|nr:type IV pilus modification protein PilV [Pseudomonas schmalbachii]MBO3276759.1 type IV pilus modification protein PilV [Pseudomonas schmalbachii]